MKAGRTHGKENKEAKRAGKGGQTKSRGKIQFAKSNREAHTHKIGSNKPMEQLLVVGDKDNETTEMSEKDSSILHLKRTKDYIDDTSKRKNKVRESIQSTQEHCQGGGNGQQLGREIKRRKCQA